MAKTPRRQSAVRNRPTAKKSATRKKSPEKKSSSKGPSVAKKSDRAEEARRIKAEADAIARVKPDLKRKRKRGQLSAQKSEELLEAVVEGMQEKKAKNILIMDLTKIDSRVTDYFVICDADSRVHVNAIAQSIDEVAARKAGERSWHTEGRHNAEWILIDYVNVVAHVFLKEMRDYYNIEGLWADAEFKPVSQ
jgi:ribosome-associated protein